MYCSYRSPYLTQKSVQITPEQKLLHWLSRLELHLVLKKARAIALVGVVDIVAVVAAAVSVAAAVAVMVAEAAMVVVMLVHLLPIMH